MLTISAKLIKASTEPKRLVTAWLSQTNDESGDYVVDRDGDAITIDAFEDALIKAFGSGGGEGRVERQHADFGLGDVVQFFTLSKAEREALGFGPGPAGAIVKLRVTDDTLWEAVVSGTITDLSFLGFATELSE